jgi:hypothetical protein
VTAAFDDTKGDEKTKPMRHLVARTAHDEPCRLDKLYFIALHS